MRILTFIVVLCAGANTGIPISNTFKSASPSIQQNRLDLKLEVFADRATYRRTDDIRLKIMIVNDSGVKDAFIWGELGFGPAASFTLFRRDAKGREVPTRFFDDFHGNPPDLNDPASLVKLLPGHFLGITYENSVYNLNLEKPGTYRLWVEYHSPISNSEVKLTPFFGKEMEPIKSNVVSIRVVP